jgi:hypothetical protein
MTIAQPTARYTGQPANYLGRSTTLIMNITNTKAAVLMVLGGLIAFANWWSVYWSYRTKRFHSAVPLVGAALLGAGMFTIPATRPYCWIALILDYGTLALLVASPQLFRELWSTSRFNLVSEYLGEAGLKTVYLRLFRRGVFTIHLQFHRRPGECGLGRIGTTGTWQREGTHLMLCTEQESAVFDLIRETPTQTLRQSVGFRSWESSPELSLGSIEFIKAQ